MDRTDLNAVEVTPTNGRHNCANLQDLKGHLQVSPQLICTIAFIFLLLAFGQLAAQQPLQLAPPQTPSTRLFAKPDQTIAFDFRLTEAEIRYTTDGSEPTAFSPVYANPLRSKGLKTVKAKSFKLGFEPSATATVQLVPLGEVRVDSAAIAPAPKKYVANGWKSLCDGVLGDDNFHANWLGFDEKSVELKLFFFRKRKVSRLDIGYLQHQGAWIFGPAEVQVFDGKGRLLASQVIADAVKEQVPAVGFIALPLPKGRYKALTIKLKGLPALPDWHPGKGATGWVFLDEVVVYQ
ncbi:MAG: chitobiase/beta-hexosaminidase C-terminal domain-containing protein [Saprospiraceae bacterium]|nr:chitobiase/beta-hexosaminidase C-terminal domain-containing protein [Saprospiraceae bacterium]